jgi:methionyl-tRNA formyltransferase
VSATGLRTAFLGNDPWSVPPLRSLAGSRHQLVRVITRVPRPAGRGSKPTPTPVAGAARELELPLWEVETTRSGAGRAALDEAGMDVLAVVAYGEILSAEVLSVPPRGAVNLHFSLLPALRGANPVRHALLEGLTETGVTTMLMDEGLDTGPILLQAREPIEPRDDAGSLGDRLARIGGQLLVQTLDQLAEGTISPAAQDDSLATWAPKLGADDRPLPWAATAASLVNRVRALAPDPCATARFRGEQLKVYRAERAGESGELGTVLRVTKEGFSVAAGEGSVLLLEVGPAGRRRMSAAEFVRGFRPKPGERLG